MAYLLPPRSASPLTVEGTSILKNVLLPHAAVTHPGVHANWKAGELPAGVALLLEKLKPVAIGCPCPRATHLLKGCGMSMTFRRALLDAFIRVGRDRAAAEVRLATHGYAEALARTELFLARASDEALCAEVIRVLDDDMNHGSRLPADCITTLTQRWRMKKAWPMQWLTMAWRMKASDPLSCRPAAMPAISVISSSSCILGQSTVPSRVYAPVSPITSNHFYSNVRFSMGGAIRVLVQGPSPPDSAVVTSTARRHTLPSRPPPEAALDFNLAQSEQEDVPLATTSDLLIGTKTSNFVMPLTSAPPRASDVAG
ncbi:hypothetical protein FPV67DRAFT_1449538 [Lyophyllum atratum]|nr:hypothetical protein FPV67DRAFT_1452736 [Lyophyllum atratum]KAF8067959.1 hypothetical protein FPV67DRAFT_1449538 [Lyophyllum atratum]